MDPVIVLESFLAERVGLDPNAVGRKALEGVLAGQMKRFGCACPEGYLTLLQTSPAAQEQLAEAVVVPETWFFRDREPFLYLKQYVRHHLRPEDSAAPLRVLSLPCSTGEEPYSIVMTLRDAGLADGAFTVTAMDISRKALAFARKAVYGRSSFRGNLPDGWQRHFTAKGRGYQLAETLCAPVCFHQVNVMDPKFADGESPFAIIFCRNLLIYLTPEAKGRVLAALERLLLPGGVIFAGHSETAFWRQHGFAAVRHPRSFACVRRPLPEKQADVVHRKAVAVQRRPILSASRRSVALPPEPDAESAIGGPPSGQESGLAERLREARRLADSGRIGEASGVCRDCLLRHRPHAEIYALMGLLSEASDRVPHALECYRKALYLDPRHYEALVHTSLLLERQGDFDQARLFRERAQRAGRNVHDSAV